MFAFESVCPFDEMRFLCCWYELTGAYPYDTVATFTGVAS